jgi:hypothetical protein
MLYSSLLLTFWVTRQINSVLLYRDADIVVVTLERCIFFFQLLPVAVRSPKLYLAATFVVATPKQNWRDAKWDARRTGVHDKPIILLLLVHVHAPLSLLGSISSVFTKCTLCGFVCLLCQFNLVCNLMRTCYSLTLKLAQSPRTCSWLDLSFVRDLQLTMHIPCP